MTFETREWQICDKKERKEGICQLTAVYGFLIVTIDSLCLLTTCSATVQNYEGTEYSKFKLNIPAIAASSES